MYCAGCGTKLDAVGQPCQSCGTVAGPGGPAAVASQPQQVIYVKTGKSSGLAAVLSFLWCGLGQIYNGQIGKGLVFAFLYFVSVLMIFVIIGLITTPLMWVWGMVDAYKTAEKMNREAGLG